MAAPTAPSATKAPPSSRPNPAADGLVKELVGEFMAEQKVAHEAEAAADARERRRRARLRPLLGVGAAALCLGAWLAPLPGAASPAAAPPTVQYTMASARLALTLAARRVDPFLEKHGRLPSTLPDANVADQGFEYLRLDGTRYVLRLRVGETTLTWESAFGPVIQAEEVRTIQATTAR